MPILGPGSPKAAKRERMHGEMKKFKEGRLHSGSKGGPVVKNRLQAIAIGLHESGQSKRSKRKAGRKGSRGGHR